MMMMMTRRNKDQEEEEQHSSEIYYSNLQNAMTMRNFNHECCFINFFVFFMFVIGIYVLFAKDSKFYIEYTNDLINDTNHVLNMTLNYTLFNVDNLSRIIFEE